MKSAFILETSYAKLISTCTEHPPYAFELEEEHTILLLMQGKKNQLIRIVIDLPAALAQDKFQHSTIRASFSQDNRAVLSTRFTLSVYDMDARIFSPVWQLKRPPGTLPGQEALVEASDTPGWSYTEFIDVSSHPSFGVVMIGTILDSSYSQNQLWYVTMDAADASTRRCCHQPVPWFTSDSPLSNLVVENDEGTPVLVTLTREGSQCMRWPASIPSIRNVEWKVIDVLPALIRMGQFFVSARCSPVLRLYRLDGSFLELIDSLPLPTSDGILCSRLFVMDRCERIVVHVSYHEKMQVLSRVKISSTGKMLLDNVSSCHWKVQPVSTPSCYHEGVVKLVTPRGLFRLKGRGFYYDWDSPLQLVEMEGALDWTGLPVVLLNLIDDYAVGESMPWTLVW
jgi:hypothetical protein